MNNLKCSECGSTSFVPSLTNNGTVACSFCGTESVIDSLPQMVDDAVKRHLGTSFTTAVQTTKPEFHETEKNRIQTATLGDECLLFGNSIPCPNLDMTNREWDRAVDEIQNLQRVLIGIRDREAAKRKGLLTNRFAFETLFFLLTGKKT